MPIAFQRLVRTRRKTIALVVEPDASLTVRAPLNLPLQSIQQFVDAHANWIARAQKKARLHAPPPPHLFRTGETFPFQGRDCPLVVTAKGEQRLALRDGIFYLQQDALPAARQIFEQWYQKQARLFIPSQLQTLASQHGFTYSRVRISSARTRWGSCSSKGTLSFSWRLMMAPPEILDYVIIHELVHTRIPNHSSTFWNKVGELLPDYPQRKRWLKQHGKELTL